VLCSPTSNAEKLPGTGQRVCGTGRFARALHIDPKLVEAFYQRGEAYFAEQDLHSAIAEFTTALRIIPSPLDLPGSREVYAEVGDSEKALADHSEALRLDRAASPAACASPRLRR